MNYPDEFDAIHKGLVTDAAKRPEYTGATIRDRASALYGYSEGAEHALDSVRLRLNRIKAQALREAADEIERLKQIGRTPHNQCTPDERADYYRWAQSRENEWLRFRAAELDEQ